MKDIIEKVILLKDMPGSEKGTEIKVYEVNVLNGEGIKLRGASVGGKFYWDNEFGEHPDFFKIIFETSE